MYFDIVNAIAKNLEWLPDERITERLKRIPTRLNEYGYDPWGLSPEVAKYTITLAYWLYQHYFRTEVFGIENVPEGRVLIIGNHSGQLPIDGMLVMVAMVLEAEPPRLVRSMVERWFPTLPYVSTLFQRTGQILGDPKNCRDLLEKEEAILVFPEGVRGSGKTWWHRYELQEFGLGFMRLALETKTPIVPFGVIGGEEQYVSLYDLKPIARLLGFPYLPVSLRFPWLGPLGVIPLPVRYRLYFDRPLYFEGDPNEEDREVQQKVDVVKAKITRLIQYGLMQRDSIFT
jgi:1-acyl-sn-glycerol-3-phosphate acyltransferase